MWSGLCLEVVDTYLKQQCMGQVPSLIIIDTQLERKKVWKNPNLPLGAMMGGRKAKRTMPDFLLRDYYSLMNWNRTLELLSARVKSLSWAFQIHATHWTSESQLRPECSEQHSFLFCTGISLEIVWETEKQNLFPSGRSAQSSSLRLCFGVPSLLCFAKEKQQQLFSCCCSEGSTSSTLHSWTLATVSHICNFCIEMIAGNMGGITRQRKACRWKKCSQVLGPQGKVWAACRIYRKKDSTNIWTGGRIKMQKGFELIPSTW